MGDPREQPDQPPRKPSIGATSRRQYLKSGLLLVVSAASLYLLLPSLLSVFSSWRSLLRVDWRFGVLVLLFEVASSVCLWEVNRIALGSKGGSRSHARSWRGTRSDGSFRERRRRSRW
jgi:hypothetical protein